MYNVKMVVLASVLAGLLLLAALPASAGMAGWQYQREIVVQENSGEMLRDYQVLVALAGSDFPEEAQADGDDIRFTDADGRELSYWIEEFDAGSKRAVVWVKVPLIPANGAARLTMWYGNPGAESASDGDTVFEFFDDFDSGIIDTDKWEMYDSGWGIVDDSSKKVLKSPTPQVLARKFIKANHLFIQKCELYCLVKGTDGQIAGGWERSITNIDFSGGVENSYCLEIGIGWEGSTKIKKFVDRQAIDLDSQSNLNSGIYYNVRFNNDGRNVRVKFWKEGSSEPSTWNLLTNADNNIGPGTIRLGNYEGSSYYDVVIVRKYTSSEPTATITPPAPATHTTISIAKSPAPHSIRQFQETIIAISIKNSGTTDATDVEITDAIHPSFDLVSGDFPNPKRYDLIRPGETRDLQYTITAKESGTFTLDPATVTYADEDGNIQEAKSEPASIKVIPSTEGGTSGGTSRNPSVSTASVQLHGEKTDVVLGEDILLKLSAVNLITKPTMHVQVIIIPPSGMSVTSSAFAKSGAGQYTTTYELEPGTGKDIEVAIRSNQVGDFDVNGRIIYYFGDDPEGAEDHTLTLPITVRAEPEQTADTSGSKEKGSSTPGFSTVVAVIGLLAAYLWRRRI